MNFLDKELVLRIHAQLLEASGGADGLRDENGLESAIRAAENRFYYEDADLAVCAATYAYHLTKAHAFVDGNKRVSAAVAEVFLDVNDSKLDCDNNTLADFFLKIAASELEREEVENFFISHVKLK